MLKKLILIVLLLFLASPMLFYLISDGIRAWKRINIENEFYIEYSESCNSIGLNNQVQDFICDIEEAYWNNDSLVVSGHNECFLIEFGKTKYNDEMIEIYCGGLKSILKNKPIKKYKKKEN